MQESSPVPSQNPLQSNLSSTFASALRDLAKNVGDPQITNHPMQRVDPPAPSTATSTILDIRKGFDRSSSPICVTSSLTTPTAGSGFQPYRSQLEMARLPPGHQPVVAPGQIYPGYHPALFGGPSPLNSLPSPYGPEADPLYQAQLARYAATVGASLGAPGSRGSPSGAPLPLGHHIPPGYSIHPSLLAGYPPEILRAYGLTSHPQATEFALLHEKLRNDEARRLEFEAARRETEQREHNRSRQGEISSPTLRPSPTSNVQKSLNTSSDALSRLSKIAAAHPSPNTQQHPPSHPSRPIEVPTSKADHQKQNVDKIPTGHNSLPNQETPPAIGSVNRNQDSFNNSLKINPIPADIKLPTKPLDISEIKNDIVIPSTTSSPSPEISSPSPPLLSPEPTTVSRCRPYTPKHKVNTPSSSPQNKDASTPKRLFVRPFEDDYSPIQVVSAPITHEEITSPIPSVTLSPVSVVSSLSLTSPIEKGLKTETVNEGVKLEDIIKPDDQDSDYESMSSDSSGIKKEPGTSILCPTSGHLLPEEEPTLKSEFKEPEPEPVVPAPPVGISSKDKLKYLRYFRLVTHRRKNDIEIEKLERRKTRLRERSPSPPATEVKSGRINTASPELPLPSVAPHLNRLPETHAKAMYLSAIGLCRNSEDQKTNSEVIWSSVLEDRLARDKESTVNKYFVKLREMAEPPKLSGTKRNWSGTLLAPTETTDLSQSSPTAPHSLPNIFRGPTLNIPSSEALQRLTGCSSDISDTMGLSSNVEINLGSLQPIAKPTLLLQEVKTEPGLAPPAAPPAHLQHMGYKHNISVKEEQAEDLSMQGTSGRRKRDPSPIAWPGAEAIIQSYKKFREDCVHEKSVLVERKIRLEQENTARRSQVDNLSTRLSSLARLHKTLVSNHSHSLSTLDSLRSSLLQLSSAVANTNK